MPTLYVIAGPNGIGKTTSFYDLVPANIPVINSDEIAKEVKSAGIISTNTQEYSNREAIRLIKENLEKGNSFAIETNLADDQTWKFLIETQRTGYQLHIIYLSTNEQDILNSRIEARVASGDHYVRPDIVLQRYQASLHLLNHYFDRPDLLQLFDNSISLELKAEIKQGTIMFSPEPLPEWITLNLGQHFNPESKKEKKGVNFRELKTIDEVRKSYQQMKDKNEEGKKEDPSQESSKKDNHRHRPKL